MRVGIRFPAAQGILSHQTNVDDLIARADSVEALLEVQQRVIALLNTAVCSLSKWSSNFLLYSIHSVLECIFPEHHAISLNLDSKHNLLLRS